MPIYNIASVMKHGILSYEKAKTIPHQSVALEGVQERRERKVTNTGRKLHSYANVYFDSHNPMLSKLRDKNDQICILAINPEIINIPGTIIADSNAASTIVQFVEPEQMTSVLNFDKIYMKYWVDSNQYITTQNKLFKCAEILVPDVIPPKYFLGIIVYNEEAKNKLLNLLQNNVSLPIRITPDRFF